MPNTLDSRASGSGSPSCPCPCPGKCLTEGRAGLEGPEAAAVIPGTGGAAPAAASPTRAAEMSKGSRKSAVLESLPRARTRQGHAAAPSGRPGAGPHPGLRPSRAAAPGGQRRRAGDGTHVLSGWAEFCAVHRYAVSIPLSSQSMRWRGTKRGGCPPTTSKPESTPAGAAPVCGGNDGRAGEREAEDQNNRGQVRAWIRTEARRSHGV